MPVEVGIMSDEVGIRSDRLGIDDSVERISEMIFPEEEVGTG
jgi:hypothetical protein